MDLGFKSDPNMHRAHKWLIQSADRSRAIVGGRRPGFLGKIGRDARINLCSVGHNRGNTLESKSGVEMGKTILLGRCWIPQIETPPLRNEAQLNCVALRSALDYEVAWRAVKGQDERQKTAPLTALHATREVTAKSEKKIRRAATSALTFMTFS